MRTRGWIAAAALSAIALAGCGSSSHKAGTSSTSGQPQASVPLPPGAPPALRSVFGRVLMNGELEGFSPVGAPVFATNAPSWVGGQKLPPRERPAEEARLKRLGFIAAVRERLLQAGRGPAEATSTLVQFRSPSVAATDLAEEEQKVRARGTSAEARPLLIPGGRGFVRVGASATEVHLMWASGPYFYRISAVHPTGRLNPPNLFDLIFAGNKLYARTHS
jgi:hypothetical protein